MTSSPFQTSYLPPVICPQCGAELSPALLACPRCRRLVHGQRLTELANEARAATDAGDPTAALQKWRDALDLLPPDSRQHATITAKVSELTRQVDATGVRPTGQPSTSPGSKSSSNLRKTLGAGGVVAFLTFLLPKGKLLLLGLTNASTFFTMLLSLGVYWAAFGWKFALGLVLSIYVHEMGHVAALLRYGMKASAPLFVPGLGALVMLKQRPADPREDARIGLAGPLWGLGAAAGAYAVALYTGWPTWAAVAKVGAWLNLFNLTPVWQLDGSRGFRALTRTQRWIVLAVLAATLAWTREGILFLVGGVALLRTLAEPRDELPTGDRVALLQFLLLVITLSAMTLIPVKLPV
jgi:Zn-dependent protease